MPNGKCIKMGTKTNHSSACEFAELFVRVLGLANSVLEGNYSHSGLPSIQKIQYKQAGERSFSKYIINKPRYFEVSSATASAIEGTPEVKALITFIKAMPLLSKHFHNHYGTGFRKRVLVPYQLFDQLMQYYLMKQGTYKVNRRLVEKMYRVLIDHYSKDTITTHYWMYLECVGINGNSKRLGLLSWEPLKYEDIVELYNADGMFGRIYPDESQLWIYGVNSRLCLKVEDPKEFGGKAFGEIYADRYRLFLDTVNALRSVSRIPIGQSPLISSIKLMPFSNDIRRDGPLISIERMERANFEKAALCQVKGILKRMPSVRRKYRAIDIALNRLEFADSRRRFEDFVIDVFIGIEIIAKQLAKDPEEKVYSKEISRLFARFMGKSNKAQKYIEDTLRAGYKVRNRIVHGQSIKTEENDLMYQVQEIFKETLVKFVLNHHNIERISHSELFHKVPIL